MIVYNNDIVEYQGNIINTHPILQYYRLVIEKAYGYFCPAINPDYFSTSYINTAKSYKYTYGGVAQSLPSSDLSQIISNYGMNYRSSYGKVSLAIYKNSLPNSIQFRAGQSNEMYYPLTASLYGHYIDDSEVLISTATCNTHEWVILSTT